MRWVFRRPRALAAVTTGEFVHREQVLPGAVLTRVAASHIRVGTFRFFAARGSGRCASFANYVIARHYPEVEEAERPYLAYSNRSWNGRRRRSPAG